MAWPARCAASGGAGRPRRTCSRRCPRASRACAPQPGRDRGRGEPPREDRPVARRGWRGSPGPRQPGDAACVHAPTSAQKVADSGRLGVALRLLVHGTCSRPRPRHPAAGPSGPTGPGRRPAPPVGRPRSLQRTACRKPDSRASGGTPVGSPPRSPPRCSRTRRSSWPRPCATRATGPTPRTWCRTPSLAPWGRGRASSPVPTAGPGCSASSPTASSAVTVGVAATSASPTRPATRR